MIRYFDAFHDFNPLDDPIPDLYRFPAGYLIQESRLLLPSDFKEVDLFQGLEIINSLRYQKHRIFNDYRREKIDQSNGAGIYSTSAQDYYLCLDYVEPPLRENGEEYSWSYVFSVLALASISDFISLSEEVGKSSTPIQIELGIDFNADFYLPPLIHESYESLGYARLLREKEINSRKKAVNLEERGLKISKTKLDSYQPLKDEIIRIYRELNDNISNRQAAKIIYPQLDEKLRLTFKTDDPEHQIERWLGLYKKGAMPGQIAIPLSHKS